MPPATQFKNWETQARLLAAAMASMDPFPRLDYKSKCPFRLLLVPPLSRLISLVASGCFLPFT